jgi:hypothetical protein
MADPPGLIFAVVREVGSFSVDHLVGMAQNDDALSVNIAGSPHADDREYEEQAKTFGKSESHVS